MRTRPGHTRHTRQAGRLSETVGVFSPPSVAKCRGSWVVGVGQVWVPVWVWVNFAGKKKV